MKEEQKILVTDDRAGIRNLLKEVLSEEYAVFLAENGEKAVETVKEQEIDLILLDLKMSGLSGLETLSLIKTYSPKTKILLMTAYEELEIINEAKRRGASGHITKPFEIEELLEIVGQTLKEGEQGVG
ncbi:MAG: two-component system response regulator [Firmicutes bacterium HGW-Firmicutes-13]|nr:MAG: two-component system response regulator [Firmicutes bacterium HGW-Firmicutes-13]